MSLSLWHLIRSFENDLSWISRVSNRYSSFWSHWFSHLRVYRIRSWWMNAIKLSRRLTIKDGEYIQILNVAIGIFEIIVCRTETLNQWSNSSYDLDIISLSSNLIIFERTRTNSLWFVYRTWHSIPDQISEKIWKILWLIQCDDSIKRYCVWHSFRIFKSEEICQEFVARSIRTSRRTYKLKKKQEMD